MKTTVRSTNQKMIITNDNGTQINGGTTSDKHGYTPIQLLTSSLGLCMFITISKLFERDQLELEEEEFSVTVDAKKATTGPSRVEQFMIEIEWPKGLDKAYQNKLSKLAERACTIGNTLKNSTTISIVEKGETNNE